MIDFNDTIVAITTPPGEGAIGVIRLSGDRAIEIADTFFSKDLALSKANRIHFGNFQTGEGVLDEVLLSVFKAPRSYTKENVIEISFHGSRFILQKALEELISGGARLARAGEFTQRAFLNGAMDLAQAEAVADLISSQSAAAHKLALGQMRGGVSEELKTLRQRLLDYTSLMELELDFGEEEVEFADRDQFMSLLKEMLDRIHSLIGSFKYGNAIKEGIGLVILGKPNAGKSTLLNSLLNDNRAIVSDIPGTTRDVIEDRFVMEGIQFRIMDTAGLRNTVDVIEAEGVKRSLDQAKKNTGINLYLFDASQESYEEAEKEVSEMDLPLGSPLILVGNKIDKSAPLETPDGHVYISASTGLGIDTLKQKLVQTVQNYLKDDSQQVVISNVRHLQALKESASSLETVRSGLLSGQHTELLSIDLRQALQSLGSITGEYSTDEVLGNIFGKFCIGK